MPSHQGLNLIIIKKHFNWNQAQELIAGIKKRVTGDIKFICLTTPSIRIEQNISLKAQGKQTGLPFNHYILMTCLKRQLFALKNKSPEKLTDITSIVEQTLSLACKFSDKSLDSATSKEIGFDGFIGFPFTNTQNEEEFLNSASYSKISSSLDRVLTCLVSKVEPSHTDLSELRTCVENFFIGQEWWQLEDEEGIHSEYHHYILRAISSLLKKFKTLKELVVSGDKDQKVEIPMQFDERGYPIIPLNLEQKDIESNIDIEKSIERHLKPVHNQNSVGKRRKPTEIGVYSKLNNQMMKDLFRNLSLEAISKIAPYDSEVERDIVEIGKGESWETEDDLHITVLYIGNQTLSKEQDAIYNRFEPGQEFPFLIHGIVYIPRTAIIGLTKLNRALIAVEDAFDHVRVMGRVRLDCRQSSSLLQQVFSDATLLDHWYHKLNKMTEIGVTKVKFQGKELTAYVLPFRRKMLIDAVTQAK